MLASWTSPPKKENKKIIKTIPTAHSCIRRSSKVYERRPLQINQQNLSHRYIYKKNFFEATFSVFQTQGDDPRVGKSSSKAQDEMNTQ